MCQEVKLQLKLDLQGPTFRNYLPRAQVLWFQVLPLAASGAKASEEFIEKFALPRLAEGLRQTEWARNPYTCKPRLHPETILNPKCTKPQNPDPEPREIPTSHWEPSCFRELHRLRAGFDCSLPVFPHPKNLRTTPTSVMLGTTWRGAAAPRRRCCHPRAAHHPT